MAKAKAKSNLRRSTEDYWGKTHRPLNCLVFVALPLVAYEVGALVYGWRLLAPRHLAELLEVFGAAGRFFPALLIVAVLLAWHFLSREKHHVDGEVLVGMAVESVFWMIPLVLLHVLLGRAAGAMQASVVTEVAPVPARVLSAIGAGIYEEFIFRLAGISLILFVFVDVLGLAKRPLTVVAVVATSVVFSLYHFIGPPFTWFEFVFYGLAGAYLAGIYILRGFGVAVGAHAAYNLLVLILLTER